jgi:glutathione synthase/RimK-type ligase-like ATP-grasp enzyme
MLVLLWGSEKERPVRAVREELDLLGVAHFVFDQRNVLDTEIRLSVGEGPPNGEIRVRDERVDLAEITAVYLRPQDPRRLPPGAREDPDGEALHHALAVAYAMTSWSRITQALVVNPSRAAAANGSKPYQLGQIRELGFEVPETLVTTDPQAARDFWRLHGDVVYKSVSGTRSVISRLRPEHAERLASVASCPTQFQRYVPGTDHRVHVVGNELFASEVVSEAEDYRYPGGQPVEIRTCSLPREVEDRCRALAVAARLPLAGIDLRRTPEGDWYCFEVNPSPAFTYYESRTGQPIGAAVARLLASGHPNVPRSPIPDEAGGIARLRRASSPPGPALAAHPSKGPGR